MQTSISEDWQHEAPRGEQETIISYDRDADEWRLYTNVPKHARKWEARLNVTRCAHTASGKLVMVEGIITNSYVSVAKSPTVSAENRAKSAARLAKIRGDSNG